MKTSICYENKELELFSITFEGLFHIDWLESMKQYATN
jgi:hypothetical protein